MLASVSSYDPQSQQLKTTLCNVFLFMNFQSVDSLSEYMNTTWEI